MESLHKNVTSNLRRRTKHNITNGDSSWILTAKNCNGNNITIFNISLVVDDTKSVQSWPLSFNNPSIAIATSSTVIVLLNYALFVTVDFFTTIALHSAEEPFSDSSPSFLFLLDGEEHHRVTNFH
ncbi:putative pentatricopeptide repeat-containing protein [Sesbania bispinosa]|nr:putative pentatricopeptide repeat-containing protein [Sesbania bispinosa]